MSIYGAVSGDTPKYDDSAQQYDALLLLAFGGPEGMEDVIPFLQKVAGGRNIPPERLEEVAAHYRDFGGVSPINAQNRALIAALELELQAHHIKLPIYFGNRNWHPFVEDTVRQMRDDGVKRALAFVTSAFSSYSSCRQYREDIMRACAQVEGAPEFDKIRTFYNHPGFIEPMIEKTKTALAQFPPKRRDKVHLLFSAHSIPLAMARHSDYEAQLAEASRLVAEAVGSDRYRLVYQSRSGPPHVPWLEPDVCDYLREIKGQGSDEAVLIPIGFLSDHMEVLFDLDTEAMQVAEDIGMRLVRTGTVGTQPCFVAMIRELIEERMAGEPERRVLGRCEPGHDICPVDCCLKG